MLVNMIILGESNYLSGVAQVDPYGSRVRSAVDDSPNDITAAIQRARTSAFLYPFEAKEDPTTKHNEGKPGDPEYKPSGLLSTIISTALAMIWDLADYVLRPIVEALIEHVLTLLHNPNVASLNDNRFVNSTFVFGGAVGGTIPYDLVDSYTKRAVRQGFEFNRAIAINLLLLVFIASIWKYWTEAAWKNGHNLMGAVGRLIATTGLILGWPIISFYLVEISNEMIDYLFRGIDYSKLHMAVTRVVGLGFVGGAAALLSSITSGVIGALATGPAGIYTAGLAGVLSGVIYFSFLGVTVFKVVNFMVLKAVQTMLMLAQFMFAPIFLVFFAHPSTERIAVTFMRSCVEVSLWTFFWTGMLRLLVIVIQPGDDKTIWGQGLMLIGTLQLMIQVPSFMAHAQISPVSEFLSPRGAVNALGSMFQGAGELAKAALQQYKKRTPDFAASKDDAVKPPKLNRGNAGDGPGGSPPGDGGSGPPLKGNPTGQKSDKTPEEIEGMDAKQLASLLQNSSLNQKQAEAAQRKLRALATSGNLGGLNEKELAAIAPLMNDKDFQKALIDGVAPEHLAALAALPRGALSASKREALGYAINASSPADLARLSAKQLAAVGPLLNPDHASALASAIGADPEKLGSLLPALSDAAFERLAGDNAIASKFNDIAARQLAKLPPGRLAQVAPQLSDNKLLDQDFLSRLTPQQLVGIADEFDRRPNITADQKKDLVNRLSASQVQALGAKLAPSFTDPNELAALSADKLAALGGHLSEVQLQGVGASPNLTDEKLAALAPQIKDPNKLWELASTLRNNPKLSEFKADKLAQMFENLNGEQISALTSAIGIDAAKVKAIAPRLKSPDQVSKFAAALEEQPNGEELCGTLVRELQDSKISSLPNGFGRHLTAKEVDELSPSKLGAVLSKLTPQQVGALSPEKLANAAATLSPEQRTALSDALPSLTSEQRSALAPGQKPASAAPTIKYGENAVDLHEINDDIAKAILKGDIVVAKTDGKYEPPYLRDGKLHMGVPATASKAEWASYVHGLGGALLMFKNPGFNRAVAAAYDEDRGFLDPASASGDPGDRSHILDGMFKTAMGGYSAYLSGAPGNMATDYLRRHGDPVTDEMRAAEVERMTNPTAVDNPLNPAYDRRKADCQRGNVSPTAAHIAFVASAAGSRVHDSERAAVAAALTSHAWSQIASDYEGCSVREADSAIGQQISNMPPDEVQACVAGALEHYRSGGKSLRPTPELIGAADNLKDHFKNHEGAWYALGAHRGMLQFDANGRPTSDSVARVQQRIEAERRAGLSESAAADPNIVVPISEYLDRPNSQMTYAAAMVSALPSDALTADRISAGQKLMQLGMRRNHMQLADVDLAVEIMQHGGEPRPEVIAAFRQSGAAVNGTSAPAASRLVVHGQNASVLKELLAGIDKRVEEAPTRLNTNDPVEISVYRELLTSALARTELSRMSAPDRLKAGDWIVDCALEGGGYVEEMTPEEVQTCLVVGSHGGDTKNASLIGAVAKQSVGKRAEEVWGLYQAVKSLNDNALPAYLQPRPAGQYGQAVGSKRAFGQATYEYMRRSSLFNYNSFQVPQDVTPIAPDRLGEVFAIYLSEGLSTEDLARPDVGFSINAIEGYDPSFHRDLAKAIKVSGTFGGGINPGMAVVARECLDTGNNRLSREILTAAEHRMRQKLQYENDAENAHRTLRQINPADPVYQQASDDYDAARQRAEDFQTATFRAVTSHLESNRTGSRPLRSY
jgi:hypothetical protein